MKSYILLIIFLGQSLALIYGQSKGELEERRKKTLEEITYVDNLLKETSKEKNESIDELKIIGRKLNLRENVIDGLREEIQLLSDRISLNSLAIEMMENDMLILKQDYKKAVLNSYRSSKGRSEISYILSAKDFNQGYKRLKYLQQITKYRRQETESIMDLKREIETSKKKQEEDLGKISDLKSKEEQQKYLLQSEQKSRQKIVNSLSSKEQQLQRELAEKKRIARKIENEIAKLLEEEKKSKVNPELTPEMKLISDNFAENKGRLPWPVEKGVITGHFGIQEHPVLKYVTENNIDIEITSFGDTPVRSVFNGVISRVFSIRGANMAVIIRHGKYLTVYMNIINVRVKQGDKVETKQQIGKVFRDTENGDKAILKFIVSEERVYLDPELWISKKN
ncbi:MAG: peptidoglycan DD-metalloendopeptidase family protein [Bacteroidota bacterium]|nr:peptidoglycan DD-metalloendopeptidase family protein [Bacteroidota bacterium]